MSFVYVSYVRNWPRCRLMRAPQPSVLWNTLGPPLQSQESGNWSHREGVDALKDAAMTACKTSVRSVACR